MALPEATQALKKYIPELAPLETSVILTLPHSRTLIAQYLGKIWGQHFIVYYTDSSHSESKDITALQGQLDLSHELVHQRQAEFLGQNRFWGFNHQSQIENNRKFKPPNFEDISEVRKWVADINSKKNDIGHMGQNSSVLLYLYEGMATAAEYMLLLQMVKHNDSPDVARKLYEKYKNTEKKYQEFPERRGDLSIYQRGLTMFRRLSSQLTRQELAEFLQSIDIEASLEIKHGSHRVMEIVRNPFLFPLMK